ncbi:MAG: hypothetical protein ACLUQ6_09430 [Alistipes onderdonkii]
MADGFRIAFCIECHKYTPVLQELCRQLQHPEADIFIHVDAKSDIGDFAPLRPLARFIHPRSKVYWGEYGQIDCMLKLLRATCNGDYRYIAILSGDTLPLRPCGADTRFPRSVLPAAVRGHAARTAHHRADAEDAVVPLPRQERLDRAPAGLFPQKALQTAAPRGQPYFRTLPPLERVPTGSSSPTASGILCSIICAPTPIISAHSDTRTAATRSFSRP